MTDTIDPQEAVEGARSERESINAALREIADWFHDNQGELFERQHVATRIATDLDIDESIADRAISQLVGDVVDPVVLVDDGGTLWVGVIDYTEHDFWYQYTDFHDELGAVPKGVCAQCVAEVERDSDVAYGMPGQGTLPSDATLADIEQRLTQHFEQAHPGVVVDVIETGADLASSTTIGGNQAIHKGNMSTEADAASVNGQSAADLAPIHDDGATACHQIAVERFGNEQFRTSNTSFEPVAGSNIALDPDQYKDEDGNLYIRLVAQLVHFGSEGQAFARIRRKNQNTAINGTQVSVTSNDQFIITASDWVSISSDSGYEAYQMEIRTGDGDDVSYNSALMYLGVPT